MKKSRSNLRVVSHIAVLALVLVIAVVATFSWYTRTVATAESGSILQYKQSGNISGNGGKLESFVGTNNNGEKTYETK